MTRYKVYLGWSLSLFIVVGVIVYLGPSVFRQMLRADPWLLFLALLSTVVIMITTTLRWQLILNHLIGPQTPVFLDLLHYVLIGATVGLLVPRDLGEMSSRVASMKLYHPITLRKVTLSVLADRAFDLIILIPFSLAALPFFWGYTISPQALVAFNGVMLLVCLGLLTYKRGYYLVHRQLGAIYFSLYPLLNQRSVLRRLRLPEPQTIDFLPAILSPHLMVGAFGWTVVKFLTLALRAFLIVWALNLDITFDSIVLATPLAQASLILAFTPGGLGFNELGWYGALALLGTDIKIIPTFLVGHRLFNYGFVLILALIVQVVYIVKSRKHHVDKFL